MESNISSISRKIQLLNCYKQLLIEYIKIDIDYKYDLEVNNMFESEYNANPKVKKLVRTLF